jgi:hypothetical protein
MTIAPAQPCPLEPSSRGRPFDDTDSSRVAPSTPLAVAILYGMMEPLLVIDDIVVMDRGLVLLPAIPREGLPIISGDSIDLCSEDGREEALVLSIDPDPHHPELVRLRIASTIHASRGVEVWPSEAASRVVLKRPAANGEAQRNRSVSEPETRRAAAVPRRPRTR